MTFPFLQTLLFSLMDQLQYYFLTKRLDTESFSIRWKDILAVSLFTAPIAMVSYSVAGIYPLFVNLFFLFMMTRLLYRRSWQITAYLNIIGILLLLTMQFLVIALLKVVTGSIEFSERYAFVAQTLGLMTSFLLARFAPLHLLTRYVEVRNKIFRIISVNAFLIMIATTVCWNTQFQWTRMNVLWLSTMAALILFINLIFLRDGLKNRIVEEQNRAYEQYLPIVNELIDDIRTRQHDLNNHLSTLKIVLQQQKQTGGDVALVERYVEDIESALLNSELIRMENKLVAGFLYSKRKQAESAGISLDIEVETGTLNTSMKDYEVLEILSILVDNAFEAGGSDKAVVIRFFQDEDIIAIEVSNRHPYVSQSEIQSFFQKNYTTKATEGRGLGLYKLQKLLKAYEAEVQVCNRTLEDNYLSFTVHLPATGGS